MTESVLLLKAAATRGLIPAEQAGREDLKGLDAQAAADRLVAEGHLTAPQATALVVEVRKPAAKKEPPVVGGCRLLAKLGQGGMGAVYRAEQVSMARQVAVKVLLPQFAKDRDFAQRFLRESRAAGAVNHPNVITCYDAGEDRGHLYMVMELMTGGDADQLMRKQGGRLPPARALQIVADAAAGLDAVHRAKLLHRDIKPGNLFLTDQGVAKLADLGLARKTEGDERMTVTGAALGTPAYMSPEQARADGELDIRSDIYALGATLFALCCGRHPYTGSSPFAIVARVINEPPPDPLAVVPDLPPAVAELIVRTMAKDPAQRPQTPAELHTQLQAVLAGLGVAAASVGSSRALPPGPPSAPTVPMRGRRGSVAAPAKPKRTPLLAGGIAVGVIALGALVALAWPRPAPVDEPVRAAAATAAITRPAVAAVPTRAPAAPASTAPAAVPPAPADSRWVGQDWIRRVHALPTSQQAAAVKEELRRRNPLFDGELEAGSSPQAGDALDLVRLRQHQIDDLSPLLGFPALRSLGDLDLWKRWDASGAGKGPGHHFTDLTPLASRPLTALALHRCDLQDLTALRGMPLKRLTIDTGRVRSFAGIEGLPLGELVVLTMAGGGKLDAALLANSPLAVLNVIDYDDVPSHDRLLVTGDLAALPRQSLKDLSLSPADHLDLSGLKGLRLTKLTLGRGTLDLAQLVGQVEIEQLTLTRLTALDCTPLAASSIRSLRLQPFSAVRHPEVLWTIPSLKTMTEDGVTMVPRDEFLTKRGIPKPPGR